MAKGNDGNYLQHSIELAAAWTLSGHDVAGGLHIALTHGMAPFEPCATPPHGQAAGLLRAALAAAAGAPAGTEDAIVRAYRAAGATLERYPNTASVLAAALGVNRLAGTITEVEEPRWVELSAAWAGTAVKPVHGSWRAHVVPGGGLWPPEPLRVPWLFSADPMTYREQDSSVDDAQLYRSDLHRLMPVLKAYAASGQPGFVTLFVYGVWPEVRDSFWSFADELARGIGASVEPFWVRHQGGNRNLAAVLSSGSTLPSHSIASGLNRGR